MVCGRNVARIENLGASLVVVQKFEIGGSFSVEHEALS